MFNESEILFLSKFFDESGYVLDFSNRTFEYFTIDSVGCSLQERYKLSKAKSLAAFIKEENGPLALKLINDLIEYIDEKHILLNFEQIQYYDKLKRIASKSSTSMAFNNNLTDKVTKQFDDDFIAKQAEIIRLLLPQSPTDVIGKSKELVESCFKHILDEEGVEYKNKDSLMDLQKKTFVLLNLDAKQNASAQNNQNVKTILNSFVNIVQNLNSLRNEKGSGHGKSKDFQELPERYAELAMNSALTLIHFVWETHKEKSRRKNSI